MPTTQMVMFVLLWLAYTCTFAKPLDNFYIGDENKLIEPRELGKRSPADAKFSSQRSERLADLRRKYTLLAILENMKGKRGEGENLGDRFPLTSDGDIDYQTILDELNKQSEPWFLVDSKRDILDQDVQSGLFLYGNDVLNLGALFHKKKRLEGMYPYTIER